MTDLILVPTPREMKSFRQLLKCDSEYKNGALQICGFGPVAAAARAGGLISRYRPDRVMLVGIAGSFDTQRFPVGKAFRFEEVACDGVGVGMGEQHQSAGSLGWYQFSGGDAQPQIGDCIPLDSGYIQGVRAAGTLLTCCSASANEQDASLRRQMFPRAVAEDMEGFSVAMACVLAGVPLQIVRGISNAVGDRDQANWAIDEALTAAAALVAKLIPRTWLPS